jgi:hypothetical protein
MPGYLWAFVLRERNPYRIRCKIHGSTSGAAWISQDIQFVLNTAGTGMFHTPRRMPIPGFQFQNSTGSPFFDDHRESHRPTRLNMFACNVADVDLSSHQPVNPERPVFLQIDRLQQAPLGLFAFCLPHTNTQRHAARDEDLASLLASGANVVPTFHCGADVGCVELVQRAGR